MASRHLLGGTVAVLVGAGAALAPIGAPASPARPAAEPASPTLVSAAPLSPAHRPPDRPSPTGPVTVAVPLAGRPDVLRAFGWDLAGFRREAAAALSLTATERFGPVTAAVASRLGRDTWFRPDDVELYAVPVWGRADEAGRSLSWSVAAVPKGSRVSPDGSVSPPANGGVATTGGVTPATAAGPVDPRFSDKWGTEQFFTWAYYNVDDGGSACPTTYGRVRGQWEYARLRNVTASSPYDYWGFAQRAVAEITKDARHCNDTIDWFTAQMQSAAPRGYPARQDPLTQPTGSCVSKVLTVGGNFGGVNASITQTVEKCETWKVEGALAPDASEWYGVTYDNKGVWNKFQRESGSLEIVRVPKGTDHWLNTKLDLDVDNDR